MRVFVTGASGWIGSAVVPELIGNGHQVVGLARSDASAEALGAAGAEVLRGTLDDLDTLQAAAADSDGVIHLAFKHESAFSGDFVGAADADRRAVEAFGETLAGSGRPLVIASGVVGLAPGRRPATERDGRGPDPAAAALGGGPLTRLGTAQLTLALAARRHPVLGGATRADVSRRGGQRLHGDAGRHRPRQGRLRLRRRWVQPLARHAPPRCCPPLPTCARKGPGRIGAARGGGGGRPDPPGRRGDRPASRPPGRCHLPRGRSRALRIPGSVHRRRRPRLERVRPANCWHGNRRSRDSSTTWTRATTSVSCRFAEIRCP